MEAEDHPHEPIRTAHALARRGQVSTTANVRFAANPSILKRLDWLGLLTYVDARDREHLPPSDAPLDPERLVQEMHVLTPDGRRLYHGFAALRWIAWRLPLLWPLAPFLYIPGVPRMGQRLYVWSRTTVSASCPVMAASARCRRGADPDKRPPPP